MVISTAGAKPNWESFRFTVVPGVGTLGFKLGEPPPKTWPETLGKPAEVFAAHGTGEWHRRYFWGESQKGQLHKGLEVTIIGNKEERTIIDLLIRRVRANVAKEDLFLGLEVARVAARSKRVQSDGQTSYVLPGLILEATGEKLTGMRVNSPQATRWRFTKWTVREGREAGPIKIGRKPDESIWQAIGKPHRRSQELLSWSSPDRAQRLEVSLDPRSGMVTRIRCVGLAWRTPWGVSLHDSPKTFKAKHPQARSHTGRELDEVVMKLPGLRANFYKEKLTGFDVFPIPKVNH